MTSIYFMDSGSVVAILAGWTQNTNAIIGVKMWQNVKPRLTAREQDQGEVRRNDFVPWCVPQCKDCDFADRTLLKQTAIIFTGNKEAQLFAVSTAPPPRQPINPHTEVTHHLVGDLDCFIIAVPTCLLLQHALHLCRIKPWCLIKTCFIVKCVFCTTSQKFGLFFHSYDSDIPVTHLCHQKDIWTHTELCR